MLNLQMNKPATDSTPTSQSSNESNLSKGFSSDTGYMSR